jgi:hypothetical protein
MRLYNSIVHSELQQTPLNSDLREAVQEQLADNRGAMYGRLLALALQTTGIPELRYDLIAVLVECASIPTSALSDAFSLDAQELMQVRDRQPVSICSCLHCRKHLPDNDRRHFLQQLRALYSLRRFEVGDSVDQETLYTLYCEGCAQGFRHLHYEQVRAERLARHARKAQLKNMSPCEYRKTPEWKVLRNRALIRAGNRCQPCGNSQGPLDVHHNSYERYGDELLEDLVVLCRSCHEHYHGVLPEAPDAA